MMDEATVGYFGAIDAVEFAHGPVIGWWYQQVPTPVGMWCLNCRELITDGDRGFVYPYVDAGGPALAAIHLNCYLAGTEPAP